MYSLICCFDKNLITNYMKRFVYLFIMSALGFFACSNDNDDNAKHESPIESSFLVSSYVRGNFYNMGRISAESMNACTDLICIGATPNQDGSLTFDSFNLHDGKGVTTIEQLVQDVKQQVTSTTRVRLGLSGGDNWKVMVANATSRAAFAQNVKTTLSNLSVAGVDLDFEWASTTQEYSDYSQAIVTLSQALGNDYVLSISLDPYSYKLSTAAIDAVTYFSLQCYGPTPTFFAYSDYTTAITDLINYGIPVSKLVPGVPFYGVTADGSKQTVAYYDLVTDGLITSPTLNQVNYNGALYDFNGQDMIAKKAKYAIVQNLYGIMSWDLATDVAYTNQWSLLKTIKNTITNNE